jgi:hypothetical protein
VEQRDPNALQKLEALQDIGEAGVLLQVRLLKRILMWVDGQVVIDKYVYKDAYVIIYPF